MFIFSRYLNCWCRHICGLLPSPPYLIQFSINYKTGQQHLARTYLSYLGISDQVVTTVSSLHRLRLIFFLNILKGLRGSYNGVYAKLRYLKLNLKWQLPVTGSRQCRVGSGSTLYLWLQFCSKVPGHNILGGAVSNIHI